jgi:pimeloyl-ACP methyl ester carboxylesterase
VRRSIEDEVTAHWIDAAFGARLRVVEAGTGPALILVPGWTMGWTVFERQIPALSPTRRVVAFDPRSQGTSTPTIDANSYAQHGRDIETVADTLGIDRFALVGWSYGALACYAYLEHAGFDRVERLAVLDQTPRPFACEHETTWSEADWSSFRNDLLGPLVADRTAFGYDFVDWAASGALDTSDREWLVEMHATTPIAAAKALLMDAIFSDYTSVAEAADDALPVLQVVRTDDLDSAVQWLSVHMPHARIESTTSHLGFWKDADAFNEILVDFLGAVT